MEDIKAGAENGVDKSKKKAGKTTLLIFGGVILFILLAVGTLAYKFPQVGSAAYNFIRADAGQIASENGKVNILIMGKSGGVHEGADLTDTMILVSVFLNKPEIKMVSIPRDIWIPEIRAKINSAYYWGKTGSPYFDNKANGGGVGLAKKMVEEVTGQSVQYGVVVDFSFFQDIVDTIGGVQIDVENGFTDKLYPIEGKENDTCGGDPTYACRYETVTFSQGLQTMNGETALKFVRSRHAEGPEGTDIAREARQQKVIDAIKNKITQPRTFLSPKVDLAMLNIARKYIETDMSLPTAGTLMRFALAGSKNIGQSLIPEDLLANPPASKAYDNLYVFIPKAGNGKWEAIHNWFQETLGK
jgi:LCP family protein required for cell wall assembly